MRVNVHDLLRHEIEHNALASSHGRRAVRVNPALLSLQSVNMLAVPQGPQVLPTRT